VLYICSYVWKDISRFQLPSWSRQHLLLKVPTVRRAVNSILQQAKPPEPNITKEMWDALKHLKEDDSIIFLPADKGRASVVMDVNNYRAKMSSLIQIGLYQLLNKDPTNRLTCKLSKKLLTVKRSRHLSEAVYNKIRPRHLESMV